MTISSTWQSVTAATTFLISYVGGKDYHPIPTDDKPSSEAASSDSDSESDNKKPKINSSVNVQESGIYTVWEHVPGWTDSIPGISVFRDLTGFISCLPYVRLLMLDLWSLGPMLCVTYVIASMMESFLPTLRLAQSSAFLRMIETAVTTKQIDRAAFITSIVLQLVFAATEWATGQALSWCRPVMQQRFKYLFNERMLAVRLRLDLATLDDPDVKAKLTAAGEGYGGGTSWSAFETIVKTVGLCIELTSTSGFILGSMLQQPGGGTIVLLCMINPLLNAVQYRQYCMVWYATITNAAYLRMESLSSFAHETDRKPQILGNVIGPYVQDEYRKAKEQFGDTNDGWVYTSRDSKPWSIYSLARSLSSDSALILLAIRIVTNPEDMALSSIAILQQASGTLDYVMWRLVDSGSSFMEAFTGVKALYEISDIQNIMKDGDLPYPPVLEEIEKEKEASKGMRIEFNNVSFKYPNTDKKVIDGLSFVIPAGSICVIVGENGCGKSSTVKLLTRTYDVDDGEILIDDRSIKDWRLDGLRGASAVMYQDYIRYDFSIRDNIGFGNVAQIDDDEAIKKAARLGGAHDFIEKLSTGYGTTMNSSNSMCCGDIPPGSALEAMVKAKKEPPQAFSGGETQRLALSRTFMRSTTCDVKLLAYDEPSAALDPKAEFELFKNLRDLRDGRTMLFITHRFGYLTKYADIIIYMDEGRAVEQGSHDELLALDGKYAHMYNVQAQAFA